MTDDAIRYQNAVYQVEEWLGDCINGWQDGNKTVDQVADDVRDLSDKIKAEGDPYTMAAFEQVVMRPIELWEANLNRPPETGAA